MIHHVPVVWREPTLTLEARCPCCTTLLYMVTAEHVAVGPRRPSGSSLLIPVLPIRHDCTVAC